MTLRLHRLHRSLHPQEARWSQPGSGHARITGLHVSARPLMATPSRRKEARAHSWPRRPACYAASMMDEQPAEPTPPPSKPSPTPASRAPSKRRLWWLLGGALLLAGAVTAGVLLFARKAANDRAAAVVLGLSAEEQQAILQHARDLLSGDPAPPLSGAAARLCGRHVFVELYRNDKHNYIFGVSEPTQSPRLCLPEALSNAVRDLKSRGGFEKHWSRALAESRLGVSISGGSLWPARIVHADSGKSKTKIKGREGWRLHPRDFEMGRDGLLLVPEQVPPQTNESSPTASASITFAPPMEALVRQYGTEDNWVQLRRFSKALFERAGVRQSAAKEQRPNLKALVFRTAALLERAPGSKEPPLNPVRGNLPYGRVDADDLYLLATRLTEYLVRSLDSEGKFDYEYYANTDKSSPAYNIVRHAGTTYSILFTYNYTGEDRFLDAGLRAKDYMVERLKYQAYESLPYHGKPGSVPAPFPEPDGSIRLLSLDENGRTTLGATALALLAFTQIPRDELLPEDAIRLRHMVNFCWYLQCDSGGFYATYNEAKTGKCPTEQPKYYPGETLLALNSLYQSDPNSAYLEMAKKSVGFELERFRDGTWPDHWVMQALNLMQQNMPEVAKREGWGQAALDMANKYIAGQYMFGRSYSRTAPAPELEGAYESSGGPPRNTPTGSRSEAVAGVYRLMRRLGKTEDAERLGDALLAAAYFLAQEMFRPENMYYLPDPTQALWGLRGSMIDQSVRIDYNQHALVGVWGAWEVAVNRKGIGWPLPKGNEGNEIRARAEQGKLVTQKGTGRPWMRTAPLPPPSTATH